MKNWEHMGKTDSKNDLEPRTETAENVAPNYWVELTQSCLGHQRGDILKTDSMATKDSLLARGLARSCDDPEKKAVTQAVREAAREVVEAAVQAVDERLETFARSAPALGTRWRPPAAPRDPAFDDRQGFRGFGEFCHAVVQAFTPGKSMDHRLAHKAPSGINTMDGSDGGFLVPPEFSKRIMELVFDEANLLPRTDSETIAGNSITLNAVEESSRATGARRGGLQGYWMAEAEKYTASRPRWRQLTLRPHKLGVFYYATEEELQDSAGLGLEGKLAQYAAEEINWLINDAILHGDGVGKPMGILKAPGLVSVAKEASQAAATIQLPNITKMYARMLPRSLPRAVWLVNVDTMPQLLSLAFPNATGSVPAFLNGNSFPNLAGAPFGSLLGRPVIVTEHNPTLGQQGDILFADLSMYKTVTRGNARSAISIHLRFDYGETAFRFDFRVDGQPWLRAPITPAQGSATLAPFVALDTRA